MRKSIQPDSIQQSSHDIIKQEVQHAIRPIWPIRPQIISIRPQIVFGRGICSFIAAAALLLFLLPVSYAETTVSTIPTVSTVSTAPTVPGKDQIICSSDECAYAPKNTTNLDSIISYVVDRVFNGTSAGEGRIRKDPSGFRVVFFHPTEAVLAKMKQAIVDADRLPEFHAGAGGIVEIKIDVIAIEEGGFSNLMYNLNPFVSSTAVSPTPERVSGSLDATTGNYNLALGFGNLATSLIKLKLDISRIQSWSKTVNTLTAIVHNGEHFNPSDITEVFTTDSNISREKDDIGLRASGVVSINEKEKTITIKGLSVQYGISTNEKSSIVRKFMVSNQTVSLVSGRPIILSTTGVKLEKSENQGAFILSQGSKSDSIDSKIMVMVTAKSSEFDSETNLSRKMPSVMSKLSINEAKVLPEGDSESLQKVLGTLQAQVIEGGMLDPFGQKLAIQLDKSELTKNTYNKKLNIAIRRLNHFHSETVSGGLIDIQSLALAPRFLPPLEIHSQCKTYAECEVVEYELKLSLDDRFLSNIQSSSQKKRENKERYFKLQYLPYNQEAILTPMPTSDWNWSNINSYGEFN